MARNEEQDLVELFAEAAELAGSVPDTMQSAAFTKAVDLLLDPKPRRSPVPRPGEGATTDAGASGDPVEIILKSLDRTAHRGVSDATGVKDRALHLLRAVKEDLDIDGLSAPQIARVLTEKFRLRTARQAVTKALERSADLVDRVVDARGPVYRIMTPGERYLDELGGN